MADNFEHPGHDEPQGGSPPEGDFPADFFDDATEPSPGSLNPKDPDQDQPKSRPCRRPPERTPVPAWSRRCAGAPSQFKAPPDPPEDEERIKIVAFAGDPRDS